LLGDAIISVRILFFLVANNSRCRRFQQVARSISGDITSCF
jgi:hypothetical protein